MVSDDANIDSTCLMGNGSRWIIVDGSGSWDCGHRHRAQNCWRACKAAQSDFWTTAGAILKPNPCSPTRKRDGQAQYLCVEMILLFFVDTAWYNHDIPWYTHSQLKFDPEVKCYQDGHTHIDFAIASSNWYPVFPISNAKTLSFLPLASPFFQPSLFLFLSFTLFSHLPFSSFLCVPSFFLLVTLGWLWHLACTRFSTQSNSFLPKG